MSRENEELRPELKAIEADLASLRPRLGRLDHQRLLFLAGRQSAAAGRTRRWAWPAAFTAMTTTAATLLVMLLLQEEPPVEIRYVRVPADQWVAGEEQGDVPVAENPESPAHPTPPAAPSSPSRRRILQPPRQSALLAAIGLDWPCPPVVEQSSSKQPYQRLLNRVLEEDIDALPTLPPSGPTKASREPVSYTTLRDTLLGQPPSEPETSERSLIDLLLNPGANS